MTPDTRIIPLSPLFLPKAACMPTRKKQSESDGDQVSFATISRPVVLVQLFILSILLNGN